MSMRLLSQVKGALARINPEEIRARAERRLRILLLARSSSAYADLEDYLVPASLSREKRMEVAQVLVRDCDPQATGRFSLVFAERGCAVPEHWELDHDLFHFDTEHPDRLVRRVLDQRKDLDLALARIFPPFRRIVARETIHSIAGENAMFSIVTALPNVIPSLAELPWIAGEFASDTAVLTANQIRMAFLLAAASDRPVGFKEQRSEIGSIIAGAWGWRAGARQLVSKVPFGGGLLPKAAIAYAGTYVVGLSLERVYRLGYGLTREERHEAYESALERGREVAAGLLDKVRKKK
jgi:hypothetical protein